MLTYIRGVVVLAELPALKQNDLDYLFDAKANTIGALLSHLASVDAWYHANTFGGDLERVQKQWVVALDQR